MYNYLEVYQPHHFKEEECRFYGRRKNEKINIVTYGFDTRICMRRLWCVRRRLF